MSNYDVSEIVQNLTENERKALLGSDGISRDCLLAKGLGRWGSKPGYRFPTIKLSSKGYAVRSALFERNRYHDL